MTRTRLLAPLFGTLLALTSVSTALAHSAVEIDGYTVDVGMLGEPVAVGDASGFELTVQRSDDQTPVAGIERTLEVSVRYGSADRALTLEAVEGTPGHYVARFTPTVAGPYSIRITGRIELQTIELELTAGADTFDEVLPASTRQFPTGTLTTAEIADQLALVRLLTIVAAVTAVAALGLTLRPLLAARIGARRTGLVRRTSSRRTRTTRGRRR